MIRFAANLTTMFCEHDFLDRIDAAADAGFSFVECQFPYADSADRIAARLARCGVEMVMFNIFAGDFAGGERGFAALPARAAVLRDSVVRSIDYAAIIGVKRLHLLSGCADPADPVAFDAYVESLRWAVPAVAAQGITLLIEPINRRDIPGYYMSDFALTARAMAAASSATVALQFDIYHRQILHGDVLAGLRGLIDRIGHVQIAAVPDRHEPGTGELDDFRVLTALERLGYTGFVGCEYRPRGDTVAGLGWLKAWERYRQG